MIRRAGPDDALHLARIHAQSFSESWNEETLSDLISRPHHHAYYIDAGGEVACFVIVTLILGEAEILTLATDPAYRGRGLARQLLAEMMSALAPETVCLEVAVDNTFAIRLYEGLGFQRAGFRKAYYVRPDAAAVDALILRLALRGA